MIGFILAAGFGTRLKPLTENIPKALVPVCGVPVLERNLTFFNEQGIKRIAINVHYLPEKIYSFRESSSINFDIFHEKDTIRGTGGALYFARDFLGSDEIFCVANADIISNVAIQKQAQLFLESDCIAALVAAPAGGSGTILYDPDSMEYRGPQANRGPSRNARGADFTGMAFYRKKVLDFVSRDDFTVLPVWEKVQKKGFSVKVLLQENMYWGDTGTPSALAKIHFDVLDRAVELKVPENYHIDYEKKIAFPVSLTKKAEKTLGKYCWIDTDMIADTADITRSVVYSDAVVGDRRSLLKMILTKWGGIPFD